MTDPTEDFRELYVNPQTKGLMIDTDEAKVSLALYDEVNRLRSTLADAKGELLKTFTEDEHVQKAFEILTTATA